MAQSEHTMTRHTQRLDEDHTASRASAGTHNLPDEVAWPSYGFVSGVLGAAVVALVFLGIDLVSGRVLWTPAALGAMLFTGERLAPVGFDPGAHLALIAGYTAIHGAVFVGFGACASFFLMTAERLPRSTAALTALTGAALFVLFELTFLAQALLFEPVLLREVGAGWVAAANACAAIAMAFFLALGALHSRPRGAR
jgi:hypothetical protein